MTALVYTFDFGKLPDKLDAVALLYLEHPTDMVSIPALHLALRRMLSRIPETENLKQTIFKTKNFWK